MHERCFYLLFIQMRRFAAVGTFIFAVALPDGTSVFVGGVPDLRPEALTTVTTYEPGGEYAVSAVFPSNGFSPGHFELNDVPLFWGNDRLIRDSHDSICPVSEERPENDNPTNPAIFQRTTQYSNELP
jgi:hypothetical protein